MSIIAASALSPSDLALPGNNLVPPARRRQATPRDRHDLAAVNRSLAPHGERVGRLYRRQPAGVTSPAACCP